MHLLRLVLRATINAFALRRVLCRQLFAEVKTYEYRHALRSVLLCVLVQCAKKCSYENVLCLVCPPQPVSFVSQG